MPQIIQWRTTPEQAHGHIEQAKVILDAFELTPGERERLFPVIVNLLAEKPIGMQPDVPVPHFALPGHARH